MWVAASILIVIIISMLGIFLNHHIISNVLFGIGAFSLIPFISNYFSRKKESVRAKHKGIRLESKENILKYLGSSSKDVEADSRQIKIIRARIIMVFSTVIFIIFISAATLFAFI